MRYIVIEGVLVEARRLLAAGDEPNGVTCVNCVTSSQIQSKNGSAVTGTIPVTSVPAGSANYIQNNTSPQAASDFNIATANGIRRGPRSGYLSIDTVRSSRPGRVAATYR